MMKKTIIIGLIVILLAMNIVFATPAESLQDYYEADKNEDINKMLELTDFSNVDSEFKEETKKSLIALAEIFDTTYYEITDTREFIDEENALVYYHLKSELTDFSGESATIDEDFVAVMHNPGIWKIVYVQPKNSFEQNIGLRETTMVIGENYVEEIDFSEIAGEIDVVKDENQEDQKNLMSGLVFILIIIGIIITVIVLVIKRKNKFIF
ncbi:MAG: hypothetical protein KJ955_00515 [Nanoarchaeota archaeon]|nr:hypothetical protein [Nanoarchaeota archaeon]